MGMIRPNNKWVIAEQATPELHFVPPKKARASQSQLNWQAISLASNLAKGVEWLYSGDASEDSFRGAVRSYFAVARGKGVVN